MSPVRRILRQLIDFSVASNKKIIHSAPNIQVHGNNNHLPHSPERSDPDVNSEGLKTVNTILRDGSDMLGAPSRWLKDMQHNWLTYIIATAVILFCVLFFYCMIRYRWSRPQKSRPDTPGLADLATIMALKNMITPPSIKMPSENQSNEA
jgi:hypothetical protein